MGPISTETEAQLQLRGILAEMNRNGFSLRRGLAPHLSTIQIAKAIGTVIDMQELLPGGGIPVVQSLQPRNIAEVGKNQYSGNYGLAAFPLHTDLAHWAIPPRYFLLRCVVGSDDVFTQVLPWSHIVDLIGAATLKKAVFVARRRRIGYSGLVRAMSLQGPAEIFRWDAIFLRPLSREAHALAGIMSDSQWSGGILNVLLHRTGDTLLVDNWRMLHGRGRVSTQSMARHVDRVYLAEVFQ